MKRFFFFLFFLFGTEGLRASTLELKQVDSATSLYFNLGYVQLSNPDKDRIDAFTGRLSLLRNVTGGWGLQGDLEQAFSVGGGLSAVYTRFSFGPSLIVWGNTGASRESILLDSQPVLFPSSVDSHQLRLLLTAEQFLLNASNRVIGLAGFGLALRYEFLLAPNWTLDLGLRWARVSNSTLTLNPLQLEAGLKF